MHTYKDMVREYSYTSGTGAITLAGAVPGYVSFADAGITNGTTVYYTIKNGAAVENGIGSWGTGGILTRTTPDYTLTAAGVVDDSSPNPLTLSGTSEVMMSLTSKFIDDIFAVPDAIGSTTPAAGTFTTLTSTTDVAVSKTITAPATTGAQTINKTAGSVNFAAAATSLVVTNSLVTTNSVIIATVATNDATMLSVQAVAGSGSFTLYANAAATAETRVNFLVVN